SNPTTDHPASGNQQQTQALSLDSPHAPLRPLPNLRRRSPLSRLDLRLRNRPTILNQPRRSKPDLIAITMQLRNQSSRRSRISLNNRLQTAILRHNRPPPRLQSPRSSLRSRPNLSPNSQFATRNLIRPRPKRPIRNTALKPLIRKRLQRQTTRLRT